MSKPNSKDLVTKSLSWLLAILMRQAKGHKIPKSYFGWKLMILFS